MIFDVLFIIVFASLAAGIAFPSTVIWMPRWVRAILGFMSIYYAMFWLLLKLAQCAPMESDE